MIDEKEQQFEGIIKTLNDLQHVKAPLNFEAHLMRKINAENFHEKKTDNWFTKIFVPRRVIPSAALAVIAVLILFVIKPGSYTIDNPFNTKPRLRNDMITTTSQLSEEKKVDKELQKMIDADKVRGPAKHKSELSKNETKSESDHSIKDFQTDRAGSSYASENFETVSSGRSDFYFIDKSGLNFRQVNLSKTERMEINKLKADLIKFMKENKLK